jgi:hypothetical protein
LKNKNVAEWIGSVSQKQFQLLLWSARREVAAIQWKELTGGAEVPAIPPGFAGPKNELDAALAILSNSKRNKEHPFALATKKQAMQDLVNLAAQVAIPVTTERLFGGECPLPFDMTSTAGESLAEYLGVDPTASPPPPKSTGANEVYARGATKEAEYPHRPATRW